MHEELDGFAVRRERIEDGLENKHWAVEQRQEENLPLVGQYRSLQREYLDLGAHSLLLGEVRRARREFAAAGLYTRQLRAELLSRWVDVEEDYRFDSPSTLRWGMCGALLSGQASVVDGLASDVRDLPDDFATTHGGEGLPDAWRENHVCEYSQAAALACLSQQADAAAEDARERYLARNDSPYTEQFGAVQRALLDDDEPATQEALQRMADEHEQVFSESFPRYWIISHGTGAHLLLARRRGMNVTAAELDSAYVPTGLDEYDIDQDFDLPRPEYVDERLIPE